MIVIIFSGVLVGEYILPSTSVTRMVFLVTSENSIFGVQYHIIPGLYIGFIFYGMDILKSFWCTPLIPDIYTYPRTQPSYPGHVYPRTLDIHTPNA